MSDEESNSKKILELSSNEAKAYFLENQSYCNFELPDYFDFEALLLKIDKRLINNKLEGFFKDGYSPSNYNDTNYKILNSKDGKYTWRTFQLINPVIYVYLVNLITNNSNWEIIKKRFKDFSKNKKIKCISIPRKSKTKQKNKAKEISNWWQQFEQKSIQISISYSYLTRTDIANFYPSIYTHSVAWAIYGKEKAKDNIKNKEKNTKAKDKKVFIGDEIDLCLRYMSYGQTNGIPIGSTLMDFIAEMVLGYADLQLKESLEKEKITEYKILRYRDDYAIFSKSLNDNKKIMKCLSKVMIDLGLQLNDKKTKTSSDIIKNSIKKGKRYWIKQNNLYWIKENQINKNLREGLLLIHGFAEKFPNVGILKTILKEFNDLLKRNVKKLNKKNIHTLISIATDIAYKNPVTYNLISSIISLLFEASELKKKEKFYLLKKIIKKFGNVPSIDYLEIWMQRIAFGITFKLENNNDINNYFKSKICKSIIEKKGRITFNEICEFEWLEHDYLLNCVETIPITDERIIKKLSPVFSENETNIFNYPQ